MRGQSSTEYILVVIGLLLMLIAIYEVSVSMNARLSILSAQIEGERAGAQLVRAIDAADAAGSGASVRVRAYSEPAQTLILSSSEIAVLGPDNQTVAFLRHLGNVTPANLSANQTIRVVQSGSKTNLVGEGS